MRIVLPQWFPQIGSPYDESQFCYKLRLPLMIHLSANNEVVVTIKSHLMVHITNQGYMAMIIVDNQDFAL